MQRDYWRRALSLATSRDTTAESGEGSRYDTPGSCMSIERHTVGLQMKHSCDVRLLSGLLGPKMLLLERC